MRADFFRIQCLTSLEYKNMFSPIFPCPLDSLWAKIQDGRHFRGKLVVHTHFVEICMCDTCSIPFSGTGNSFPCTTSSLCIIWDHNWAFKHHLIPISRSFKVHPYRVDMIGMASPVLNHFIWLLTYIRVSKHDSMQYGTIANNIPTTTMPFQGHVKVMPRSFIWYQTCMAYD